MVGVRAVFASVVAVPGRRSRRAGGGCRGCRSRGRGIGLRRRRGWRGSGCRRRGNRRGCWRDRGGRCRGRGGRLRRLLGRRTNCCCRGAWMTGRRGATARRERENECRYASDGQLLHGLPFQADPPSTAVDVLAQRVTPCIRPGILATTSFGSQPVELRHRAPELRTGRTPSHLQNLPARQRRGPRYVPLPRDAWRLGLRGSLRGSERAPLLR